MPDIFSQRKRSAMIAAIRSRGNKATELRLIAIFRRHGITGWRRHRPLFGKPDLVFPKTEARRLPLMALLRTSLAERVVSRTAILQRHDYTTTSPTEGAQAAITGSGH